VLFRPLQRLGAGQERADGAVVRHMFSCVGELAQPIAWHPGDNDLRVEIGIFLRQAQRRRIRQDEPILEVWTDGVLDHPLPKHAPEEAGTTLRVLVLTHEAAALSFLRQDRL